VSSLETYIAGDRTFLFPKDAGGRPVLRR